jgi:hypothetical protein
MAPQFIRENIVASVLERRTAGAPDSADRFTVKSAAG